MFGIGIGEILVIFLVALLVLGPDKLPQVARTLAKLVGEFRRASDELKRNVMVVTENSDWHKQTVARVIESSVKSEEADGAPKKNG